MTVDIETTTAWNVPARIIYDVLTDASNMTRLGLGAKAEMVAEEGASYSWFDGQATGKIVKLEANKHIQLTMKMEGWAKSSNVDIDFKPYENREGYCMITLKQTEIPLIGLDTSESVSKRMMGFWESRVWNILDKAFGFGRQNLDD